MFIKGQNDIEIPKYPEIDLNLPKFYVPVPPEAYDQYKDSDGDVYFLIKPAILFKAMLLAHIENPNHRIIFGNG